MKTPFFGHILIIITFLSNSLGSLPLAQAQDFRLPAPGVMVHLSPQFNPPILKGIKVHPDNPFRFEFILDKGDNPQQEQLKQESVTLIKYFLASLTVPEKDLWVNLSPYEKDRIIPYNFGLTAMGRDLLAEDYMLKQITASLIYPEGEIGKKFWKRIYQEAASKYGTTDIPVNTFNKVWIVPQKAVVYENAKAGTAYVVSAKLKVMLEQDYLSLQKHAVGRNDMASMGANIVREIVIPELTKEVNEGKNFARLRQVYNSLILAVWYKRKIRESILARIYENKNKVQGVKCDDSLIVSGSKSQMVNSDIDKISQRYLQSFKKGSYNFIKEEIDPITREVVPRKYFSGGMAFDGIGSSVIQQTRDSAMLTRRLVLRNLMMVGISLKPLRTSESSTLSVEDQNQDWTKRVLKRARKPATVKDVRDIIVFFASHKYLFNTMLMLNGISFRSNEEARGFRSWDVEIKTIGGAQVLLNMRTQGDGVIVGAEVSRGLLFDPQDKVIVLSDRTGDRYLINMADFISQDIPTSLKKGHVLIEFLLNSDNFPSLININKLSLDEVEKDMIDDAYKRDLKSPDPRKMLGRDLEQNILLNTRNYYNRQVKGNDTVFQDPFFIPALLNRLITRVPADRAMIGELSGQDLVKIEKTLNQLRSVELEGGRQFKVIYYPELGLVRKFAGPQDVWANDSVVLSGQSLGGLVADFIVLPDGSILQEYAKPFLEVIKEISLNKKREDGEKIIGDLFDQYFRINEDMISRGIFNWDMKLRNFGVRHWGSEDPNEKPEVVLTDIGGLTRADETLSQRHFQLFVRTFKLDVRPFIFSRNIRSMLSKEFQEFILSSNVRNTFWKKAYQYGYVTTTKPVLKALGIKGLIKLKISNAIGKKFVPVNKEAFVEKIIDKLSQDQAMLSAQTRLQMVGLRRRLVLGAGGLLVVKPALSKRVKKAGVYFLEDGSIGSLEVQDGEKLLTLVPKAAYIYTGSGERVLLYVESIEKDEKINNIQTYRVQFKDMGNQQPRIWRHIVPRVSSTSGNLTAADAAMNSMERFDLIDNANQLISDQGKWLKRRFLGFYGRLTTPAFIMKPWGVEVRGSFGLDKPEGFERKFDYTFEINLTEQKVVGPKIFYAAEKGFVTNHQLELMGMFLFLIHRLAPIKYMQLNELVPDNPETAKAAFEQILRQWKEKGEFVEQDIETTQSDGGQLLRQIDLTKLNYSEVEKFVSDAAMLREVSYGAEKDRAMVTRGTGILNLDQPYDHREVALLMKTKRILKDWVQEPDPLTVLDLVNTGIDQEIVRKSAATLDELKRYSNPNIESIKERLLSALPYYYQLYQLMLKQYPSQKILLAGRDARIIFLIFKILAHFRHEDDSRFVQIPGSTIFYRNDKTFDSKQSVELLKSFGVTKEGIEKGDTYVLIDSGFAGTVGDGFRKLVKQAFGINRDISSQIPIRLVYYMPGAVGSYENVQQINYFGPIPSEFYIKMDGVSLEYVRGIKNINDMNYFLALMLQNMPQYHGRYANIISHEGEIIAASASRGQLTNYFEPMVNADFVNPVAALILDVEMIKKIITDMAMSASLASNDKKNTGGIDMRAGKFLFVQDGGRGIRFHIDPTMLKQLQDASGFVPVIISIQPLIDLKSFLGIVN